MFKLEKVGALYIVTSLCNINVVTCFMTAAIRGPGPVPQFQIGCSYWWGSGVAGLLAERV